MLNFQCSHKNIKDKIVRCYYKTTINHELDHPPYSNKVATLKIKMMIAKLRTNSHEVHSVTRDGGF